MTRRSYGQYCAVAHALDDIGDRWTLLVVRELLEGPKRFRDLQAGLPGIATDILTERLRSLEAADVVRRRELPPPAGVSVYELTDAGRELQAVLVELARWGMRRLPPDRGAAAFRPTWLVGALRALLRPEETTDVDMTVEFVIGNEATRVQLVDGDLHVVEPVGDPDVTITADVQDLVALVAGREPSGRPPQITGAAARVEQLARSLGIA